MTRTVFKALSGVQRDLSALGIGKGQRNQFDKYNYRGIDDVLNAMAPILSKHGVLIVPSVKSVDTHTVTTAKGGSMNHSVMCVDYTMYDAEGDSVTHTAYGEAMDRGDKSINKAMTAAYKYFLFQSFCIPLVGNDADAESHEIQVGYITSAQAKQIRDAIKISGTTEEEFCGRAGTESVDKLLANRYQGALKFLQGLTESAA